MPKKYVSILWVFTLTCFLLFSPITMIPVWGLDFPQMPPTIEEITKGRVKIGDLVTKENVDLVKEYLPLGVYECVKEGMVLRMVDHPSLEKMNPKTYLQATEQNVGKAVLDEHGVVRLSDGSEWPGGLPFTEPKTGMEVMASTRWGHAFDNVELVSPTYYVNKSGRCYKRAIIRVFKYFFDGRLKVQPLGSVTGSQKYHFKFINVFTYPLELKGLGQLNINHDDDYDNFDAGFAYLPAFKRTIRISATTFQDNVGGTDFTYGDPEGLREPFGQWEFRLLSKKLMLTTSPVRERQPVLPPPSDLLTDLQVDFDGGMEYPKLGWTIAPTYVVEATPRDKGHIYEKKILYVPTLPFFASSHSEELPISDIYARGGELWKSYYDWRGGLYTDEDGENYTWTTGMSMHDLLTGHRSFFVNHRVGIDEEMEESLLSLKSLLMMGR